MAIVRPFRGARPVPARVDPTSLALGKPVADVDDDVAAELLARDPRNAIGLLRGSPARAAFLLKEQLRAGVVVRDVRPSLYVLKVQGAAPRLGFFAVVRADSVDVDGPIDPAAADRLQAMGVAVEPAVIRYSDQRGRVARSLESETEREPDAAFVIEGRPCELWAVDDDSAVARVTALIEAQSLRVAGNAPGAAQRSLVHDDDARGFALAFFVDEESPVDLVPIGVVLHTLTGAL